MRTACPLQLAFLLLAAAAAAAASDAHEEQARTAYASQFHRFALSNIFGTANDDDNNSGGGRGGFFSNIFSRWFGDSWRTDDDDADCQCVVPFEEDLCRDGAKPMCEAVLTENVRSDTLQEKLLFQGCLLALGVVEFVNCRQRLLPFLPKYGVSGRRGAKVCYGDQAIRVAKPARGNCDAGSCCQPEPEAPDLCPLERYMHFTMLSNGVTVDDSEQDCDSSLDYYGGEEQANCSWLTDGLANTAIVCSNATVTTGKNNNEGDFCDVTISATNDVIDGVREGLGMMLPSLSETISYQGVGDNDGKTYSFSIPSGIADIAFARDSDSEDGINELVYKSLQEKGCLESSVHNPTAIHVLGHSLGAFLVSALALQLGALHPDVTVKITTVGEPAFLVEPLTGAAAALPCWQNKVSYTNGMVLPRSSALDGVLGFPASRTYGFYQMYDFAPQVFPGGFFFMGDYQHYFSCEVLQEDGNLSYFLAGPEGCASGRTDVLNDMPVFPHQGAIESDTAVANTLGKIFDRVDGLRVRLFGEGGSASGNRKLRHLITAIFSITEESFRNDVIMLPDLHATRRYLQFFNRLTHYGGKCDATEYNVGKTKSLIATCNAD